MSRFSTAIFSSCLLAAAVLASCQATTGPSPTALPSGSAAGSPSEPLTSPGSRWGPLAVIPPQVGTDLYIATGTLLITDTCVYLVAKGEKTLLFWPADRTRWKDEAQGIVFSNFDGTLVTASDGDAVAVTGGGDSEAESGMSGPVWASGMVWVAPPDPSCSAQLRFGVGALKR